VSALRALTDGLRRHTATPEDCVFAFWEGWRTASRLTRIATFVDGLPDVRVVPPAAQERATPPPVGRLSLPGRVYALFRGSLDIVDRFGDWATEDILFVRSPNLFWPADRAWFVATEVDFDPTLVGGSIALLDDLLRSSVLETTEVEPTAELHSEADTVNR
jgi:hypothetical protein